MLGPLGPPGCYKSLIWNFVSHEFKTRTMTTFFDWTRRPSIRNRLQRLFEIEHPYFELIIFHINRSWSNVCMCAQYNKIQIFSRPNRQLFHSFFATRTLYCRSKFHSWHLMSYYDVPLSVLLPLLLKCYLILYILSLGASLLLGWRVLQLQYGPLPWHESHTWFICIIQRRFVASG